MLGLNLGSGQRRFGAGWVNLDIQVAPDRTPDLVGDMFSLPFKTEVVDLVVSHHSLEHFGCGEGRGFIEEAWRVLRHGGSLLVFVPDMRALARRWLTRGISTQIYLTNVYGAYMGDPHDRHLWGFDHESLVEFLGGCQKWSKVTAFDWRFIEGADIARDFWILGAEAIK